MKGGEAATRPRGDRFDRLRRAHSSRQEALRRERQIKRWSLAKEGAARKWRRCGSIRCQSEGSRPNRIHVEGLAGPANRMTATPRPPVPDTRPSALRASIFYRGMSIKTMSEFSFTRSKTIRFPSGVISKLSVAYRPVKCARCVFVLPSRSCSQKSMDSPVAARPGSVDLSIHDALPFR